MIELSTDLINGMNEEQMRSALHSVHAQQVLDKQKADEQARLLQEAEQAEKARLDAYFERRFNTQSNLITRL